MQHMQAPDINFCTACRASFLKEKCKRQDGVYYCPNGCGRFDQMVVQPDGPSNVYHCSATKPVYPNATGEFNLDLKLEQQYFDSRPTRVYGAKLTYHLGNIKVKVEATETEIVLRGEQMTINRHTHPHKSVVVGPSGVQVVTDFENRLGVHISTDGTIRSGKWNWEFTKFISGGVLDSPKKQLDDAAEAAQRPKHRDIPEVSNVVPPLIRNPFAPKSGN